MHSWTSPHWGPTPGVGWTRPRCPGGSGNFSECYLNHFQQVLLKEFCSKRIPGLLPIRVLPLGQGGRTPDVRVCLDIFQKAACIISQVL